MVLLLMIGSYHFFSNVYVCTQNHLYVYSCIDLLLACLVLYIWQILLEVRVGFVSTPQRKINVICWANWASPPLAMPSPLLPSSLPKKTKESYKAKLEQHPMLNDLPAVIKAYPSGAIRSKAQDSFVSFTVSISYSHFYCYIFSYSMFFSQFVT